MRPNGLSDRELAKAGFFCGVAAIEVLGPFDPTEDRAGLLRREEQPDDIWEQPEGIFTTQQSSALLLSEPMLWGPVLDFQLGLHELQPADIKSRSSFEVDALLELIGARCRSLRSGDGDG